MRALVLGTVVILAMMISALMEPESGFGIWAELSEDLAGANARVERLERENEALRGEIELIEADPTALDRAIREELDLALPGELVVRFRAPEDRQQFELVD